MEQAKEHAYSSFGRLSTLPSRSAKRHRDMPDQLLSIGPSGHPVTLTLLLLLTLANRYKKVTGH